MQHLKRVVRTSAIQIWNKTRSLIYQKFERNQCFRNFWWRSKFQTLVKTEPTDRFGSSFDTKSHSHIPISMQSFSYLPPLWKNNVIFGVLIKLEFKPSFSGKSKPPMRPTSQSDWILALWELKPQIFWPSIGPSNEWSQCFSRTVHFQSKNLQ